MLRREGEVMGNAILETCENYDPERLAVCMERIFAAMGGLERFVRPGMQVVLKPNLLSAHKPADAATTHPAFVEAVARAVMKAGGNVTILDSPGGPYSAAWLKRVYAATGMEAVANATGALLNYDLRVEPVLLPDGMLLKRINLLKPIVDADLVINLAKLKTHMMMVYTGAVKNLFGAVAGTEKADYHARMNDYDRFAEAICDIYCAVGPAISLIDGITAMEGEGPGSGVPRHLGVVIAAENAFDADALALGLINVPWQKVPIMRAGERSGAFQPESLETSGVEMAACTCREFDVPALALRETGARPGRSLLSRITAVARPQPVINAALCIRCGRCAQACPVKTIVREADGAYKVLPANCIRCFCCHELCPEKAIVIRRGVVSKLLLAPGLSGRRKI